MLSRHIKAILLADQLRMSSEAGTEGKYLLATNQTLIGDAWNRMRGWYKESANPDGTTNTGVTRIPDNLFKGIQYTITWNPDNPLKEIHNLVPNGIRSQWPIGLTVPT